MNIEERLRCIRLLDKVKKHPEFEKSICIQIKDNKGKKIKSTEA